MNWSPRMHRMTLVVLTCATSLSLASAPGAAQREPPELVAEVIFEPGSQLHENLGTADRLSIERELSSIFAQLGQEQFPFLRWVTAADRLPQAGPPISRLTARVVDNDAGAGFENRLHFSGRIAGEEWTLPQLRKPKVFDWFELDKHDPVRVQRAVAARLEELFGLDADRQDLHDQFLGSIPLSREVVANDRDHRVIVPLAWDRLQAGPDSVLLVEFRVASEDGPKNGLMRLSSVKKRLSDPHPGSVEGLIVLFDFPPTTLTTPGAWDPTVSETVALADALSVFMETYVQRLDTGILGDLVTDPRPGTGE